MPNFIYKGRTHLGEIVKGQIDANTSQAVAKELMAQHIIPLSIESADQKNRGIIFKKLTAILSLKNRSVSIQDRIMFCRQISTLLKAGIPLVTAINKIAENTRSAMLTAALKNIVNNLSAGLSLTAACRKYPEVFSPIAMNLIAAGEQGGQLDASFLQISRYLALELDTRKKIKKATRYPISVLIVIIVAMLLINFIVVPKFSLLFASFKATLPLPTRILMGTSQFLLHYWLILLILVIISFTTIRYIITKTLWGGEIWDHWKIKLPIFGSIFERILLGRFSRTLTMISRTGIPLIEGLKLASDAAGNRYIKRRLAKIQERVERGTSFARAVIESNLFPPLVVQMLDVGEESGMLDHMLEEIADFYEGEVEYDLTRLGDLIEPILLMIIAGLVLIIMLAVFLPMWDLISVAQK